jgi:predicted CoA-binding protein
MLPSPKELRRLFEETRTIAVVGASADEAKQAHRVPRYLQAQGYRILPVNPQAATVLGEPAVDSLAAIEEPVDVVQIFRPADEAPAIARAAAALGAGTLWLQLGIVSEEAELIGREAHMTVVMDACMGAVHRKLARHPEMGS